MCLFLFVVQLKMCMCNRNNIIKDNFYDETDLSI